MALSSDGSDESDAPVGASLRVPTSPVANVLPILPDNVGPFSAVARDLHARGLAPVPCDGKTPCVKGWQRGRRSSAVIDDWAKKFGVHNIGVSCGPSGVVVVDVDDPAVLDRVVELFGPTPLVTRTPGGGRHFWYRRTRATPSRNLRRAGLAVDIKADDGCVVVPPSRNPAKGGGYDFVEGSWSDLPRLPAFRNDVLDGLAAERSSGPPQSRRPKAIPRGERNNTLFRHALVAARTAPTFGRLLADARLFNDTELETPLPDAEVVKTVSSAWRYQQEGKNWSGTKGDARLSYEDIVRIAPDRSGGDAALLVMLLQTQHAARSSPFAIVPRAMARDKVLPWTEHRFRKARDTAIKHGFIERIYTGGRNPGDPSLYVLKKHV